LREEAFPGNPKVKEKLERGPGGNALGDTRKFGKAEKRKQETLLRDLKKRLEREKS